MAHLARKKGVCHARAAFCITSQHTTTFSLGTRNPLMNFAMLLKYIILAKFHRWTIPVVLNTLRAGLQYICTIVLESCSRAQTDRPVF